MVSVKQGTRHKGDDNVRFGLRTGTPIQEGAERQATPPLEISRLCRCVAMKE